MFYEIIISGAGLTGLLLGLALTKKGYSVLIFDCNRPDQYLDGRTSAISYGATKFLTEIGIWQHIQPFCSPIYEIYTSEKTYSFALEFKSDKNFQQPLGYMIKNCHLKEFLYAQRSLNIIYNTTYKELYNLPDKVRLVMEDGKVVDGLLFVAAEGKNSPTRNFLKFPTYYHNYKQSILTCCVTHLEPHNNIAQERFYPDGPFALLPLHSLHESCLIWTTTILKGEMLRKLPVDCFLKLASDKSNLTLDSITSSVSYYPISLAFTWQYYKHRTLLLGDAAHSIHPVAGQGFNLTIYDIEQLIKSLYLGVGSKAMLENFSRARLRENLSMTIATHSLIKLFSYQNLPLQIIRNTGLSFIDNCSFLKNFFRKKASGI